MGKKDTTHLHRADVIDINPSTIRHVSSTNTSLISTELIKHTLFFTASAHILARVNTKFMRT